MSPGHHFPLATRADDAALRRLLRENPMAGALSMTLEREPDFFLGATVEGDVHDVVLARDAQGQVFGMGSRAVRDAYVNGEVARLGYLGQLRVDAAHRGGRRMFEQAFEALEALHRTGDARLYVTTIIEDNRPARRLLTSGRLRIPLYVERAVFCTLAFPLRRWPAQEVPAGVTVRDASAADLPGIVACLERNHRRFQFAPVWTEASLTDPARARGLSPTDFVVALRNGRVEGCLSLWNQSAFKQSVVRGYGGALKYARPVINALGPLFNLPHLPTPGTALRHAFLSHVAVDGDDAGLLLPLVARGLERGKAAGLDSVMLGLAERHPALPAVQRTFRHFEYRAVLHTVHWADGAEAASRLDGRVPHLDLATL